MEINSWEEIKKELRACYDNRLYLAALSLILIMPDVLGKLQFPALGAEKNKRPSSKEKYIKWVDDWLGVEKEIADDEDCYSIVINGELAYRLRCALFHNADNDIAEQMKSYPLNEFEFDIDDTLLNVAIIEGEGTRRKTTYQLNVWEFCKRIGLGVRACIKEHPDFIKQLPYISMRG